MGFALFAAGAAQAEAPRIVLLPIIVHSAEPDTAYLSEGLADTLAARLELNPGLMVVRVESGTRETTRREVAVQIALEVDADFVIYGSFTQFGSGASLDVHCASVHQTDGYETARRVFIQSGSVGEIIPKLDELASKIGRYVVSGEGTQSRPEAIGGEAPMSGASASAAELEDLRHRVEALERAIDPAKALEELGGIDELAPGGEGTIGLSDDGPASAAPGAIPLR